MPSTDEPGPARSAARVIGWLVVTPLMCLVIARLARLGDRSSSLFAIETLTIFAYLPAYFAFGMAVIQRQRALAGVAAVVMIAHIAWVAPDLRWWPTESDDGTAPFRVVAANLRAANTAPEDAARSIAELNADVLIATELTPALQRSLQGTGTLDELPHRIEDPRQGFYGSAIYSRFPLANARTITLSGYPTVRATLATPEQRVTVVAVHTLQPFAGLSTLRAQLRELEALSEDIDGPVILAGDFNATRQHRSFRSLLDGRLRDAHLAVGRGLARTWPAHRRTPPFALLDHVLVSDELAIRDVEESTIPGSDHRAVTATLAHHLPDSQ